MSFQVIADHFSLRPCMIWHVLKVFIIRWTRVRYCNSRNFTRSYCINVKNTWNGSSKWQSHVNLNIIRVAVSKENITPILSKFAKYFSDLWNDRSPQIVCKLRYQCFRGYLWVLVLQSGNQIQSPCDQRSLGSPGCVWTEVFGIGLYLLIFLYTYSMRQWQKYKEKLMTGFCACWVGRYYVVK